MNLFKQLSPTEEHGMRIWARANYQPFSEIKGTWHPVAQDECVKMNAEAGLEQMAEFNAALRKGRETSPVHRGQHAEGEGQ